MNKNVTRDRSWRRDMAKVSSDEPVRQNETLCEEIAEPASSGGALELEPSRTDLAVRAIRDLQRWIPLFRQSGKPRRERTPPPEPPIEAIVHDFAESLVSTTEPSEIAMELIIAARRLTGATRVELTDVALSDSEDDEGSGGIEGCDVSVCGTDSLGVVWKIPVGFGIKTWGFLQLSDAPSDRGSPISENPTARPLKTLCTLAALALEGISTNRLFQALEQDDLDELIPVGAMDPMGCRESLLRDATYLNAILPYAINQAHRHREPLSILSVGIDRLPTIHEMFGAETVCLAMKQVGEIVVSRLRSSDVVGRMEDDRILAMLPHATASDASRIAEEIRTRVAEQCQTLEDLPALTVSIGAATFPTHARDVLSLLNAADEAMFRAERLGRNQVVVAGSYPCG